jgi:2-oxo-4-hydroxy-4-carboxy-5-ureidoimidazoline decarboxylase
VNRDAFVIRYGTVFERSPWVAEEAWEAGPFDGIDELHAAMVAAVERAPRERRVELIRAHPDLAGRAAVAGELTPESEREQASAGLDRLTPAEYEELTRLNTLYAARHGFPFVICVREHTKESILDAIRARVGNETEEEERVAIEEIGKIARLRLEDVG